jgi:hypothetical protein
MAEYAWPCEVLRPRNVAFNLNERTLGSSPSVSGYTQVVSGGPPIWSATFGEIDIRTKEQRLAFKALSTLLQGRINVVIVPLCRGDQPVPVRMLPMFVPHDDDTPHDDGAPYLYYYADPSGALATDDDRGYYDSSLFADGSPFDSTLIVASVGASAAAGTATINMQAAAIGDVQAGHLFSIENRLYRITGVTDNGSGNYDLSIWPPLRLAVSAGDWMEFDNPKCRMRLASDQEMSLDLSGHRFARPTVNFIEDLS